jgi:hypothetical protein
MKRILLAGLALALAVASAHAQSFSSDLPTTNGSVTITTGNTFQTVLAATTFTVDQQRKSVTIQNNNTSDSCWVFIGAGTATKAISILLTSGGSYQRYFPYVPSDAIQATCASNGDTLYIDTQ